jgi:ComF family protein
MSILALLDLLLPRSCLLCGAAAEEALCAGCTADLPLPSGAACPQCAAPLPGPAPACADCLRHPPAFDATVAALRYTYPIDRLVQQLKFGGRHAFRRLAAADFLAARMLAGAHPAGDVIVPVPLSRQRLAGRGFNQALEIARPLARALQLPLDTAGLVRVRETPAQSRLPWRARRANVRRAFECRADFSGKSVIVVDDVMTSGATLDAVARVLKDHGARQVTNWVAARAARQAT